MTTPQQSWQRVTELFEQALEHAPEARAKFLDSACADDVELRREVESLLTEHDAQASFLEKPAVASLEDATELFSSTAAPRLPERIGPYKVIKSLGMGGMGEVYLTHDERLNRPVAVKMLSGYNLAQEERIRRFRREALSASALNHPNILTIYEIGEADGKNFIATEFVDGQTLLDVIKSGPVSLETATDLAIQVAGALSVAHAAGIIHRDIKPANIMVRADGLLKVLDFGVAKYHEADARPNQSHIETEAGTVIGTAAYMSPEQARGLPLDPRTDLWSAGAMLYELVSGVRPFKGETALDTMAAVIEKPAQPFSVYGIDVPDSLERIVFKALEKDRDRRYQSAGAMLADLKQFAKSLEAGDSRSSLAVSAPLTPKTEIVSIAVLPFLNMSADPENEYFCDGLSEELLNALTRVENLKVAARTSAFSFKGKSATASGIGRALNVNSILEGSVRKSANKLRITVQLINAADGYHLWSERYDRELQDIFDVQDEIALSVVDALKVTLLKREKDAVLKRHTENVEAYQLYLKGRYYWWKSTPEDFHKSREFFQRAVEADPNYALGYCGLSSYFGFGSAFGFVPPEIGWPKAIEANRRAKELDDTLAEVHNDLAGISMVYYRDPAATEREALRAVELNPKFQEIHYLYSNYLLTKGQFDAAIREAQEAVELDPLSVRVSNNLGYCYYLVRRYDEAVAQFEQALELDEHNPMVHEGLADALEQKGHFAEAIKHCRKALELTGEADAASLLQRLFDEQGFATAMRGLAEKRLEKLNAGSASGDYIPAIKFVRTYVRLGDVERAFEWLEKACAERNVFALILAADPFYDPLRVDPRFDALLRRFNLSTGGQRVINSAASKETAKPASTTAENQSEPTIHDRPEVAAKHSRRRYLIIAGLVALLALAMGFAIWAYRGRQPQISTIAVMPFKNESGNTDIEYLSDGMTDSLITSLSQLPQLSVKARSSVFRYRGKELPSQQLGNELNVQAILVGSLKQRGNDLNFHVELVDAKTETALWSNDYDRSLTNLATLQSEIARDVSRQLRVRLSGADEQKVARNYTQNNEAYQLYLKGRYHALKVTLPEIQIGISYFQQAIAIDPSYALAYVGLAGGNRGLALGGELPANEYMPKAKAAAQKAIEIDDTLAEAHSALGFTMFWYDWDWYASENQCKRALELDSNSSEAHLAYAHLLSNTGRHAEALGEAKRARELDPLNLRTNALEGQFLIHAGRIDEGLDRLQKTFELDPNFWFAHLFASSAYSEKGLFDKAVTEAQKARDFSGGSNSVSLAFLGYALAKSGRQAEARGVLKELSNLSATRYVPPYHIALVYNGLGEREQALAFLERGYSERDPKMAFLKVEPKWNNLRADPRFQDLLRRVGFPS